MFAALSFLQNQRHYIQQHRRPLPPYHHQQQHQQQQQQLQQQVNIDLDLTDLSVCL